MDDQNSRVKLGKEGWTPVAMWQTSKTAFLVWLHLRQVEDVATCLRACGLSYKTVPGEPDIGAAYKTNCGDHTLLQRARTGTKLHFTHGQWTASATASVNLTTHARTSRLWPLTRKRLLRVIVVYDDHPLVDQTCQKWFARFKSSNFDLKDEERPGALLKFEEARLDEDETKTQKKLAKTLGVTQPAILLRLKEIGMIRKVGNWVRYELKPKDVECRFSREKLLQLGPLRLSKTLGNLWIPWPCLIIDGQAEYSWREDHAVYLVGPVRSGNYELLQPNERITGEAYRRQLMRLNMRLIHKK
ncbi:hypothetical protein LAZ67_12003600 [Cordylochernes scorpioides]|uniref:Mariner Mos1 transposase n=1 Tax=Cordylochernes scorpioides TaxID=51811 RepID=A0ABY6L2J4_9ARAC|nr:hypothetical protein LAZ67_12003600 [Cordylochernes scorpioides]